MADTQAAIGLIIDPLTSEVLLLQRFDDDRTTDGWCLAGGRVSDGEDIETALIRQIKQEVGLDVEVKGVLCSGDFQPKSDRPAMTVTAYRVEVTGGHLLGFPTAEHKDAQWLEPKDAMQRALAGDVTRNALQILCDEIY